MKKIIFFAVILLFSFFLNNVFVQNVVAAELQVTLEATYSIDVSNGGTKYYHDGNDYVGRDSYGIYRTVNRWNIASIDPSWDIVSVEVRFYTESKTGSPGALSITRYGSSHGEDNPESDTGSVAYTKSAGSVYASLPEPSSGSWTGWINLGTAAVSDILWCRDNGISTWSLGLKASDTVEASTTVRHADFSEDNETNDAEIRITYTVSSSNTAPTAVIDSITPNPATVGQSVTFTGHGVDTDGTIAAYEWTSSITGALSTGSTFSTSSLPAGTHTISLRVQDDDGAWSSPVTSSVTISGGAELQVTLEATYSVDVGNGGAKYYHDGNDWVGRGNSGILRTVNRWNIASIDPSWDIVSVEVRFYTESKTGSPGALSITRYGSSHGEDNPESDTGSVAYTKSAGSVYASLPEPSSGSWTGWINLGTAAVSDILWCRDNGISTWSLGLKASDTVEASTTVRHADFSEDNETNDAEIRITYTVSSSNTAPTAVIDSITPNPATVGQSVTFTGHGVDTDGTIAAYEWTSSITGALSTGSTFSTSSLPAGTHTISLRVQDDDGAWSSPVTSSVTISSPANTAPTAVIDSITPNPATVGQSVTFTGHGVDTDGTIAAYEWTSSITGALSTGSTFSTSSLPAGTHTISLRVQDDDGAWSSPVTSSVTISSPANTAPTAVIDSITPNPATVGQSVTFTGHGVDTDGTIAAYEWTSSITGALSTGSTFSTSSLPAGTHTISLRVQDDDGAWSSPVTSSVTISGGAELQVTLEATYSVDVGNGGAKYYHDGNDWVGRGNSGILRTVNRWNIASIDPSWDIVSVEVRFYTESKTGSPGALSITRYGSSHGEDNPESDTGSVAYTKSAGSVYASLPEPSSGSWTGWINLGTAAVSDILWCRDNGISTWSLGLKASDTVEASTTVRHADFSEDNETNDAEIRITYIGSSNPPESHQITKWANNKAGAVSITFDDGYYSQFTLAVSALNEKGFQGTFFLITGVGNWDKWRNAANQGHEIASHTNTHPHLPLLSLTAMEEEIGESKTIIDNQITSQQCVTFCYPYGEYDDDAKAFAENYYIAARGISCDLNTSPYDFYAMNACGDSNGKSLAQIESYTDDAEQQGEWLITYYHNLDGTSYWTIDEFTSYLDHLETKDLWVGTFGSVVKYIKERESANLSVVSSSDNQIVLSLTDTLDNAIFDEPLTIRSEVPLSWTHVTIQQGSGSITVTPITEGTQKVIYYNVVPDGGLTTLENVMG